jgi:hypothetical protein
MTVPHHFCTYCPPHLRYSPYPVGKSLCPTLSDIARFTALFTTRSSLNLRALRFSQRCWWGNRLSRMWQCVTAYLVPNVSRQDSGLIIKDLKFLENPRRWDHYAVSKRREPHKGLICDAASHPWRTDATFLNFWRPRFPFSAGNRWHSLSDKFPWHNNQSV